MIQISYTFVEHPQTEIAKKSANSFALLTNLIILPILLLMGSYPSILKGIDFYFAMYMAMYILVLKPMIMKGKIKAWYHDITHIEFYYLIGFWTIMLSSVIRLILLALLEGMNMFLELNTSSLTVLAKPYITNPHVALVVTAICTYTLYMFYYADKLITVENATESFGFLTTQYPSYSKIQLWTMIAKTRTEKRHIPELDRATEMFENKEKKMIEKIINKEEPNSPKILMIEEGKAKVRRARKQKNAGLNILTVDKRGNR